MLLLLVGLGQSRYAGLVQNRVLRQVSHGRWNVSRRHVVFRRRQVLRLVVDDVGSALQAVDGSTNIAAEGGNRSDCVIDERQGTLSVGAG